MLNIILIMACPTDFHLVASFSISCTFKPKGTVTCIYLLLLAGVTTTSSSKNHGLHHCSVQTIVMFNIVKLAVSNSWYCLQASLLLFFFSDLQECYFPVLDPLQTRVRQCYKWEDLYDTNSRMTMCTTRARNWNVGDPLQPTIIVEAIPNRLIAVDS